VQLAFPFHLTRRGREAHATPEGHVRDMIEQVLFTSPGERVNRPDFGCGLMRMTFTTGNEAIDTATQSLVMGSLQQWLGHVIQVEEVQVSTQDDAMRVTVRYAIKRGGGRYVAEFVR
jgi:phage baseplate assembly protein W